MLHTGFGFVEFEEKDDAAAAIDNMHNSEIYGRVLRVNYAQPMKIKGGDKGWRWVASSLHAEADHSTAQQAVWLANRWTEAHQAGWQQCSRAAVRWVAPHKLCAAASRPRLAFMPACSHQPVWADADQYFAEQEAEEEFKALEEANAAAAKRKQHQPQQQAQAADGGGPDPMEALEAAAGAGS